MFSATMFAVSMCVGAIVGSVVTLATAFLWERSQ